MSIEDSSSGAPPALEPPFGVIGLGAVGGSLVRALRALSPTAEIIGVDTDETARRAALKKTTITRALSVPGSVLSTCNVLFVCVPVGAVPRVLEALAPHVGADALVTDVTGVKGPVEKWAKDLLPDATFIGGHPLVGGHKGGFDESRAALFEDVPIVLCPPEGAEASVACDALAELWRRLGAHPLVLTSHAHDELVAQTSHLSYLVAVAQVALLADNPEQDTLVGRGFEAATRYADFDPEVMAEVVSRNPAAPAAARRLAERLLGLADFLESEPKQLVALAGETKRVRERLLR